MYPTIRLRATEKNWPDLDGPTDANVNVRLETEHAPHGVLPGKQTLDELDVFDELESGERRADEPADPARQDAAPGPCPRA